MAEIVDILDDDELYRRLVPDHLNDDGTVNSNAFKLRGKPDPRVSVDLRRLTTPEDSLRGARRLDCRLGVLVASVPRGMDLTVRHDPNPPEAPDNYAHSLIEGLEGTSARQKCRDLAAATRLHPLILGSV